MELVSVWENLVNSTVFYPITLLEELFLNSVPNEKKKKLDQSIANSVLLNPFPNKPWILHVCSTSLLKTAVGEKEKLLIMSIISFSHSFFYPFEELSATFIKFEIVVCKLFQFERV